MEIPKEHQAIMPYLILKDAARFMEFVKTVFDAEVTAAKYRDDNKTVMHAEFQVYGSTVMFAEATEQWKEATGNLFIYVDNADETYYKALNKGATTIMELSNQPYGRTCGVADSFGNVWWITSVKVSS